MDFLLQYVSHNRMKVIDNLKIQDGAKLPSRIFIFAIYSLIVANQMLKKHIKFSDSSCNKMKVMLNLKIPRWELAAILDFRICSIFSKL